MAKTGFVESAEPFGVHIGLDVARYGTRLEP